MNDKQENGNEVTETNKDTNNFELNGKNETKKESPPRHHSFKDKIRSIYNNITVEPFLLCFVIPIGLSGIATQKLNMEKACRTELHYSEFICTQVVNGVESSDNITTEATNAAIKLVADMTSWQSPLQSAIPAIATLFVGAWSDKTGNRKALMIVPLIGQLISSFGLFWATYFFLEWPLWVTALIDALPYALSGGFSIALLGSYSFLADVTTLESRTFRLGTSTIIVSLGIPFGSSISGVLTNAVGYYGIFSIGMAIYTFGILYTYFRIHNPRNIEVHGSFFQKLLNFLDLRNIWATLSLLFFSRGRQLAQIILVIVVHMIIIGPGAAEASVIYLYALGKFKIDPVEFSLFITYSILIGTAGTAVAIVIFSKLLKLHDALLGIIATVFKTTSNFVYGLAPTKAWFYSGPAFDFFGGSGVTAIRSLGTKVVKPEDVGKMCSLLSLAEALIPVIYTPIYAKLFSNTVDTFPGAFYVLGGVMTIPACINFIVLYILHKKQQRDIVQNPADKETHVYDNDVTAL